MNWDLDEILEQSLTQIESGKARVESCLVSFPAAAAELEPLLRTAQALRSSPRPELSPRIKARIQAQLLDRASLDARAARCRKPNPSFPGRTWVLATLGAMVLVMFLVSSGAVWAAGNALPGSGLYPLKLATEMTWLSVTPSDEQATLHLRFAQRRLHEVQVLGSQGTVEATVLEAMTAHFQAASRSADRLPHEQARVVLRDLATLGVEQENVILALLPKAPPGSHACLEKALQVCRKETRYAQMFIGSPAPVEVGDQEGPLPGEMQPASNPSEANGPKEAGGDEPKAQEHKPDPGKPTQDHPVKEEPAKDSSDASEPAAEEPIEQTDGTAPDDEKDTDEPVDEPDDDEPDDDEPDDDEPDDDEPDDEKDKDKDDKDKDKPKD